MADDERSSRWRFCRLSEKTYVVDSSCLLVSARLGRFGPKLDPHSLGPFLRLRVGRETHLDFDEEALTSSRSRGGANSVRRPN